MKPTTIKTIYWVTTIFGDHVCSIFPVEEIRISKKAFPYC
jgi:hypothetical protein